MNKNLFEVTSEREVCRMFTLVVRDFNFLGQLDARHNIGKIDRHIEFYTHIDLANQIIRVNTKSHGVRES